MLDLFAKRNFSFEKIPDLTGKVAIVTGSSTGVKYFLSCQKIIQICSFPFFSSRSVKYVPKKWLERGVLCK